MKYSLTLFRSIFDNTTSKRMDFGTWQTFERLLYSLSKLPGYKAKRGERKRSSPLISPAIYKPDCTRSNANVIEWAGWAALDVDNYEGKFEDIIEKYKNKYYFVCYSTASSTKEKPKFRLVFPLSCPVSNEKIRHFWYALSKEFNSIGDEQAKDFSRMYYVPAQYPNADNFIFTVKGEIMNPAELMSKHEFSEKIGTGFLDRLPDNIKKEILKFRKESMLNRDVKWNSYRDCPFVNKKLINEYKSIALIDGSGRYRMIYKLMTSIACNAVKNKYAITSGEIAEIIRQLDMDTANIYQQRPLKNEADRAIEYAYRHATA